MVKIPLRIITLALAGSCAVAGVQAAAETLRPRATVLGGLDRTDSAPGTGAVDGVYYGVQLGADWYLGGLLAGVEGEIGDSTASAAVPGNRARQGLFGNAAVRVAVPFTDHLRGFVRGGYAYHQIDYTTGPAFKGSGYTLGGGGEVDLGERLFLRGEYRYSNYGKIVRGQQFLLGAGVKF
jgi:outer membrane immunogenic protein